MPYALPFLRALLFPLRPLLGRLLLSAVHHGRRPRARALLALGAPPNVQGPDGFTPLTRNHRRHDASCADLAQTLIEGGADVGLPNAGGMRALDYAALFCLPNLCALLLAAGADPQARNPKGLTPVENLLSFYKNSPPSSKNDSVRAIESIFERQALSAAIPPEAPNFPPRRRRL